VFNVATDVNVEVIINAKRVGRFQIFIATVGILVLIADGFDLQILSYLMPRIVEEWAINAEFQGVVLSAGYFGVMIGYLILSPFSARIGLKRMVVVCLVFMGLFNVATITATNPTMLLGFRIATGISLGGVFPPAVALTCEYFPERYRASVVTIIYVGLPLGFLVAGSAAWLIVAGFGWRAAMILGGVIPLTLAILVSFCWPESLEFLINRAPGGMDRARRIFSKLHSAGLDDRVTLVAGKGQDSSVSVLKLFSKRNLVGTLSLWLALSLNAMVYFFVLSWLPLILVRIGASHENAIIASSLANFGGIFAAFITGPLMDRFGGYLVVLLHFAIGACFASIVGVVLTPAMLVILPAAFCLGFCVSGLQKGISALAMNFYPIELRSAGLGWVFGIGRSGAIAGPMLAGSLMGMGWAPASVFYVMSIPLLIGGISIAVMWRYYQMDDYQKVSPPARTAAGSPSR
jgi:AAHS family 4-hydroxybenzoate transporter-like MFS transporter